MSEETFRALIIIMAMLVTGMVTIVTVIAAVLVIREAVWHWRETNGNRKEQG